LRGEQREDKQREAVEIGGPREKGPIAGSIKKEGRGFSVYQLVDVPMFGGKKKPRIGQKEKEGTISAKGGRAGDRRSGGNTC